jgi:hypothetical protein
MSEMLASSIKRPRRSVAAALAAGNFGQASEINPAKESPPTVTDPVSSLIKDSNSSDIRTETIVHEKPKVENVSKEVPETPNAANVVPIIKTDEKASTKSSQTDKPIENSKKPAPPALKQREIIVGTAGRRERGQAQMSRKNRTFRASHEEFEVVFDILDQVRRSPRLTRSQAHRIETSTIIRAALHHVSHVSVDALLDQIIRREDFENN